MQVMARLQARATVRPYTIGGVALHHVAGAVAHVNHVDASLLHQRCYGVVVGGQYCYLFASALHLTDALGRNLLVVTY